LNAPSSFPKELIKQQPNSLYILTLEACWSYVPDFSHDIQAAFWVLNTVSEQYNLRCFMVRARDSEYLIFECQVIADNPAREWEACKHIAHEGKIMPYDADRDPMAMAIATAFLKVLRAL